MAARMPTTAVAIINSIRVNPLCLRMVHPRISSKDSLTTEVNPQEKATASASRMVAVVAVGLCSKTAKPHRAAIENRQIALHMMTSKSFHDAFVGGTETTLWRR